MDISEFKYMTEYRKTLKEEESLIKGKEFTSLVPLVLKDKVARVRDFIDVDGTFAVLISGGMTMDFATAISTYLDVVDIVESTTYTKVENTGLIKDLVGYSGFWIKLAGV
jgi:hypothetical protein